MKEYAFNLHALWTVAVTHWVCPELFVLVVSNFLYKTRAGLKPKLKKKLNVVTYAEILLQLKNNGTRMQDIWHNEV